LNLELLARYGPRMLEGLLVTIELVAISVTIGALLALPIAFARMSRHRWLRAVSFGDDKRGLIVGAQGTIALTDDGGFSWKLISGYSYDMKEFGLADF